VKTKEAKMLEREVNLKAR